MGISYIMLGAPLREWCLAFVRPDCTDSPRNCEGTYKREPLRIHGLWKYQNCCGGLKGVHKCCQLRYRLRLRPGRGHGSLSCSFLPEGSCVRLRTQALTGRDGRELAISLLDMLPATPIG